MCSRLSTATAGVTVKDAAAVIGNETLMDAAKVTGDVMATGSVMVIGGATVTGEATVIGGATVTGDATVIIVAGIMAAATGVTAITTDPNIGGPASISGRCGTATEFSAAWLRRQENVLAAFGALRRPVRFLAGQLY